MRISKEAEIETVSPSPENGPRMALRRR